MKNITNKTYDLERSLYNLQDAYVDHCSFKGPNDGESVLKETRNVTLYKCDFDLRYPLWHAQNFKLTSVIFNDHSRAPLWYCSNGVITFTRFYSVKAVRECEHLVFDNDTIYSNEFGWRNKDLKISNTSITSEYALFESQDLEIEHILLKGKYSYQYVKNARIGNSELNTKDAFWHSENVTVTNSVINGEYLGWFSKGLTLINCKITGRQPLCYCEGLKLIDCEMINCDLAFEYSDVNATIKGKVDSIKNPKSGMIKVDKVGEIITTESIMESKCQIVNSLGQELK